MNAIRTLCLLLPLVFLVAGCSSPAQRIQKNQEYFDSLPVSAQARIRGGQIDLGFTPEMVRIALGEPQRQVRRRVPGIESEIWYYIDLIRHYERQRADLDGLRLSGPGGLRSVSGSAWVNVLQERESIRSRVEFQNGVVVAIEEPAQDSSKP